MYVFGGCDPDLHKPSFVAVKTEDFVSFDLLGGWQASKPIPGKGTEAVVGLMERLQEERLTSMHGLLVHAVAVEEIEVVTSSSRGANPQSQVPLAISSGAMGMWLKRELATGIIFARTQQWKGSQPKKINQARTCRKLGLDYKIMGGKSPYCVPTSRVPRCFQAVNAGDWKHLLDSAGLAIWVAGLWYDYQHGQFSSLGTNPFREAAGR